MNYFLSMKIHDHNNDIPLMSEHSDDISVLVDQAENVFELLTRNKSWDRWVIGDDLENYKMSDAAMNVIEKKIIDFDWSFPDKFDRAIHCYITRNV